MEDRVSLANLDDAIAEALKGTSIGKGRVIYGFLPPDWYDKDEAMKIAKTVTSKMNGDFEPAVMKVEGQNLSLAEGFKNPYIVGFIGPIDPRIGR